YASLQAHQAERRWIGPSCFGPASVISAKYVCGRLGKRANLGVRFHEPRRRSPCGLKPSLRATRVLFTTPVAMVLSFGPFPGEGTSMNLYSKALTSLCPLGPGTSRPAGAVFVLLILFTAAPALAQTTGTLSGTVADQTGAVLPGVTILAGHVPTGTT